MNKITTKLDEIKLVGITARTSNKLEMQSETAKIGTILSSYFGGGMGSKINDRANPGITYCVYTDYESDEHGEYTYFVGEEVDSFDEIAEDFTTLTIPVQNYAKFTVGPGAMPEVCIGAWQKIWQMQPDDFGGVRNYIADFEVYDERAANPANATLDIYIGTKIK